MKDILLRLNQPFLRLPSYAWLIAKRKAQAHLALFDRRQSLHQWQARLAMFLIFRSNSIGAIGGGKAKRTGVVDVAVFQSPRRIMRVQDFVAEYGQVIVDECHHLSAFTFEQVMRAIKAKFIVALRQPHKERRTSPHHSDAVWAYIVLA